MNHIRAIIGLSSLLVMMVGIAVGQQWPALLDPRPIESSPIPAGELDPQLQWMATEKVRLTWIGDDLFDESPGTDKTKAEVLAEADFNTVQISMTVDRDNRDTSPDITDRLPANMAEAHRVGLHLLITWQYGTSHQEPYRRYRGLDGVLAEKSCCPLDTEYIGRHIGRWAVALAQGGADGMMIDTEMYGSDAGGYSAGPCVSDDCFADYLQTYSTGDWESLYNSIPPDERGTWLAKQGGAEDTTYWWTGVGSLRGVTAHYARYQRQRIAAQYEDIRVQCQQINPLFLFGCAPGWNHLPGLEKGLGTPAVPCLILSEHEYHDGPYNHSYSASDWIRAAGESALFLPGAWVRVQSPEKLCRNALLSSLHCDGWWIWYGTALLRRPDVLEKAWGGSGPHPAPYGRYGGTTAWDYLDRIAMTHRQLERLLTRPRESWPVAEHLVPRPAAGVPRRQGAVTIDGILDESAWEQAAQLNVVANIATGQGAPPTEVLLCWDDEALYVAARCGLPSGVGLQAPQRSRDDAELQQDEGIQVFLDPGRAGQRYAYFVISASGQVYDSLNTVVGEGAIHSSAGWNANVTTAVAVNEGEYVLEARLPFREIAPAPQPGQVWEGNFARVQPVEAVWSHTAGGVHVPARFGRITFQGE